MINKNNQQGVGLVEVLVALLLLAVGVLGYSILQFRAIDASSEALTRSQGVLVLRSLAENIRVNSAGQANYPAAVRNYTNITTLPSAPSISCFNPSAICTPAQAATYDAYFAAKTAFELGMNITMTACPGTAGAPVQRQCLFAAWGDTVLSVSGTTADISQCMSATGVYVSNSKCLMMEAY
ncbi:type IV pilus modification protein PilV [Acinetobacter modestus]|nr:type IV pilus modification protein PilV [Acinetobacter modestus]MCH7328885.1 type IV pilus modification protein PilV [Acinetobacter modestus]